MARINLLPWRDERRQLRKREFFTQMAVAAGLAALTVFGGMMFMNSQIELQTQRNQYLKDKVADLDRKIVEIKALETRKSTLLKKKEIIENLQGDRSLMLNLFIQLSKTIPEGVALGGLKQAADLISLDGRAQSEARVAQYSRNLESSAFLKESDIVVVTSTDAPKPGTPSAVSTSVNEGGFRKTFSMKIKVDRPKDNSLIEEDKVPEELAPDLAGAETPPTESPTTAGGQIPAASPAEASAINNGTAPAEAPPVSSAPIAPEATPANVPASGGKQ